MKKKKVYELKGRPLAINAVKAYSTLQGRKKVEALKKIGRRKRDGN